ncbi:DUF2514 family protein [Variovorax boronicumulans]|uniref:DUF2514 family protein n=1 Tax=Variovorax boronicumulans TaxID=436515 RepID=UPI0036F22C46
MILPDLKTGALWALGLALAAALAAAAWQGRQAAAARADAATVRADFADYRATAAESARLAEKAERQEEERRHLAQGKALDEERARTSAARADADGYLAAAGRLQSRLDAAVAAARAARAKSAAAGGSSATADPIGVLADVLVRCERRVGLLAAYADKARIAGATCEASYDALTPAPSPSTP